MAGPIVVSIVGDNRKLMGAVDGSTSKLGKLGSIAGTAGKVAAAGLAVAGVAAVGMAGQMVSAASDAQQSLGATETVFGKFADKVEADSKRAATQFGLSANDYRENANLIGALFKNQGVEADQLAGKTKNMIGIGADLAATFGGTTTDAVGALSAAFKGEFDSLEKYGISLSASKVSAELAATGQDKLTGAALAAAKQQVTTSLIMRDAGDAAGAFGRETDTLANRQQVLGASWENLQAKGGALLLPLMTKLTSGAISLVGGMEKMGPPIQRVAGQLGTALAPAAARVGGFITGTLVPAFQRLGGFIVGQVVPAVVNIAGKVRANLAPVISQLGSTLSGRLIPALSNAAGKFREMYPTIVKVVTGVVSAGTKILGVLLPPVIRLAGFIAGNLIPAIVGAIGVIIRIASTIQTMAGMVVNGAQAFGRFAAAVRSKIGEAINVVQSIPGKISGVFSGAGTMLYSIGSNIVAGLVSGIRNAAGSVLAAAQNIIDMIPGPIRKRMGIESPSKVMKKIGGFIVAGLVNGISEGEGAISSVVGELSKKITDSWEKLGKGKKPKAGAVRAIMKSVSGQVKELRGLARQYEAEAARLDEARQLAAGVTSSAAGFGSINGLGFRDEVDDLGNSYTAGPTAAHIVSDLGQKVAALRTFTAHVDQLRRDGLNQTTIDEIISDGVEKGSLTASALVAGGPEALAAVNGLQAQVQSAAGQLGQVAAVNMYGTGQQAAAGFTAGLESDLANIEKVAGRIAKRLVRAIRKELKIKSPSRVAMGLARQFTDGLVIQTERDGKRVELAGKGTAQALVSGFDRPQLNADAVSSSAAGSGPRSLHLTADALDALQRGREIQADLDTYRRAGGRSAA